MRPDKTTLVIACGAIAHELVAVVEANNLNHIDIQCLPAEWHNTPDKIAPGVDELLTTRLPEYESAYVAYADCGTGGHLDTVIEKHGVERLFLMSLPKMNSVRFSSPIILHSISTA